MIRTAGGVVEVEERRPTEVTPAHGTRVGATLVGRVVDVRRERADDQVLVIERVNTGPVGDPVSWCRGGKRVRPPGQLAFDGQRPVRRGVPKGGPEPARIADATQVDECRECRMVPEDPRSPS